MWNRIFKELVGAKFVREVTWLQVGKSLSLLAGFGASIVYANVLGPEKYGIYAIIVSLAGIISAIINFGIWPTTVTLISEAIGRKDREEVKNLIIYFLKFSLLIINAFWLVVILLAPQIVLRVYGDISLAVYLRMMALGNAVTFAGLLLVMLYQVARKIDKVTYYETLKKFVFVGAGVTFVWSGFGVVGIFYGMLVAEITFFVAAVALLASMQKILPLFPSLREVVASFWGVKISKYLKFGLQIAVDKNINNFVENLPTFMLGIFSTPEQAGLFKVGYSIGTLPKVFSSTISRLLSTIFPFKEAEQQGSLKMYYHKVAKYGSVLTLGFMAAVFIGTKLFFERLYGADFLPALPSLYIVLSLNLLMGFAVSFGPIVRTLKKMAVSINLNMLALAVTALIGYLLIPQYGATGAAISMSGWFIVSLILTFKIEQWLKNND